MLLFDSDCVLTSVTARRSQRALAAATSSISDLETNGLQTLINKTILFFKSNMECIRFAKPQVSLTVPNCDQFVWVSMTILDFLDAIAKAKKLIFKSVAQNLEQDLLTKRLFSFGNGG